ncbi:acetyl-CoA synthetase-like protein, partial [Melanomma pulvis-pyrius CBS 109.77]
QCNIRLLVKVLRSGVSVFLEYRNSFIPTEHARNIASTVDIILSGVLTSSDVLLREATLLSDRNRSQIQKWNSTSLNHVQTTIHDTIADSIKKFPTQEAICSWDGILTYQELGHRAARLASYLIGMGVGPEVVVPLCFDKSKWNIVAMLGVMIAGGAFLPLDPAAPKERIQHLANATSAEMILCSRTHAESLENIVGTIIAIDEEFLDSLPTEFKLPESRAESHNLAYIIPTSGTTGQPKLTLLEHGNYCTGAKGHVSGLLMDTIEPIRALQFAAHSFDASIVELLTPLMIGGTVCIPDEHTRLNDIAKVINDMRVTWASLTPTFVRFLHPSMVPTLTTIGLVGEAMSQANLDTWTQINLINGYGPSECAVAAVLNTKMTAHSDAKNIGFAISSHAWVVNPNNYHELLPIGCVGELLIEGHIVGRGYLNDDLKTSQAFIHNVAWAGDRQFRGYLTGDLVVQNPDGSLNIIGRKDSQVVSKAPYCDTTR